LNIDTPSVFGNDTDYYGLSALTAVLDGDVGHVILTLNPDRSFDYMPAVDLEEDNRKVI